MKNLSHSVPRRQFLTSAAATIGAGLFGIPTALADAGVHPTNATFGLWFWNGGAFVTPASIPSYVPRQTMNVSLESFGSLPNLTSIDVQMPGGVVHALTPPPSGLKRVSFNASVIRGLNLALNTKAGSTTLSLLDVPTATNKLSVGSYVITTPGISLVGMRLDGTSDSPLTTGDGLPSSLAYIVLTVA